MKGGASYYQAAQYANPLAGQGAFKLGGGRRLTRRALKTKKGGFYPSLMGGVLSNGPLFFTPAIAQAARLLRNESERMSARTHRSSRKSRRATTKRSNRKGKNTRKA